jgi:hypothetical protein
MPRAVDCHAHDGALRALRTLQSMEMPILAGERVKGPLDDPHKVSNAKDKDP